jgi:two-component system chemotaxis response regulator CheB
MTKQIKIAIIDDAILYRKILSGVVERIAGAEVVGEYPDGNSGIAGIQKTKPDIVFLDVEMPGMNGLEVLEIIKTYFKDIEVILISSSDRKHADVTIRALNLGAIDFISKPIGKSLEESIDTLYFMLLPLINLFVTKKNLNKIREINQKITGEFVSTSREHKDQVARRSSGLFDLLAIGTSTGGPAALSEVIPKLPEDFPVPVVLVQHMPPNFTASLANSLDKKSKLKVVEAKEGDILQAGKVYIAPGDFHMVIKPYERDKYIIRLETTEKVNACRPSVDVLFDSIAQNFNGNVLAVVMTGMGSDGTNGVRNMKKKNCYCLIQDAETCVVFGMPKVVLENQLADEVLPLGKIAPRIVELVK